MTTIDIGELQMVSKHSLINGYPTDYDPSSRPIIRDCGCAFRFTTTFRKNRLRTAVRPRKSSRSKSIQKIKDENESKVNISDEQFQPVPEDSKNMCTETVEDTMKYSGYKQYSVKYLYDYKTCPVLYKSTLTIPFNTEEETLFREEILYQKKIYAKRVIETVTTITNGPIYKATIHINCNSGDYVTLDNNFKTDQADSEC
ncbi:uncharacterized protein LOC123296155 [Chrysoperla carnea]|uniref:uncharacterized protein LOC123296155 n=1 Tax=Chrysoperla carnea TaxID=189513 RepID=UPI001D084331|nr:uncharacterized protein LOC123296155 [Chrysoperla carnea]